MPRTRPWYKREPAAWLHGTRELTLEERGAYGDIIEYLNDRDSPLPDEDRFIAGLLNCPPQRWRKIRQRLLDLGKIMLDEHGRITNDRFEREHAGRELYRVEQARHAREAHEQREPGFDFDPARAPAHGENEKSQQSSKKHGNKVATNHGANFNSNGSGRRETPKNAEGTQALRTRAPRVSELEEGDSTLPTSPCNSRGRLLDADLMELFDAVCETAGYRPTQPSAIDRALRQVETWREEGMDFDKVVIPTIRKFLLDHAKDGPTRTLGRFRSHIAHEHARQKAAGETGRDYRPPKVPIMEREDEDNPAMSNLRSLLAQALGPNTFALWFNDLHLSVDEDRTDWLTIRGRMSGPLNQSGTMPTVNMVARRLGYTTVLAK